MLNSQDNLTLLQQYGSNSWRVRNYLLESTCATVEKLLEEVKEKTTDIKGHYSLDMSSRFYHDTFPIQK